VRPDDGRFHYVERSHTPQVSNASPKPLGRDGTGTVAAASVLTTDAASSQIKQFHPDAYTPDAEEVDEEGIWEDFEEVEQECTPPRLVQASSAKARVRKQQAQFWQQLAKTNEEQAHALEQQAQVVREQADTILQLRQQLTDAERTAVLVAQEYELV
jgi:hypothetical protein